jgi:hypothetical protein
MDIQQIEIEGDILMPPAEPEIGEQASDVIASLAATLAAARRPLVLWGGGIGLAGVQKDVLGWLDQTGLPFVSSWAGLTYFDHDHPGFLGQISVYGNRGANFALQNADAVVVIGSRLDNRQRSGNARNFATGATIHVIDIDEEELKKYANDGYRTSHLDFRKLPEVLAALPAPAADPEWAGYVATMKERYYGKEISTSAARLNTLSPYDVVRQINAVAAKDAIVVGDTGAALCWLHQAFRVKAHTLFTAGGNSPMGYALPAAIGAKLVAPHQQVISYNGDGGFQLNLQELQTVKHYNPARTSGQAYSIVRTTRKTLPDQALERRTMARIAFLGANSQIAKDLILSMASRPGHSLGLFSRCPAELAEIAPGQAISLPYAMLPEGEYDAIVNFVGSGDPARIAGMGGSILEITYEFDTLALGYIRRNPRHPLYLPVERRRLRTGLRRAGRTRHARALSDQRSEAERFLFDRQASRRVPPPRPAGCGHHRHPHLQLFQPNRGHRRSLFDDGHRQGDSSRRGSAGRLHADESRLPHAAGFRAPDRLRARRAAGESRARRLFPGAGREIRLAQANER